MSSLKIFGQPIFPARQGSTLNVGLRKLQHMAQCKRYKELAKLYADLITMGLQTSDAVVKYIQSINPQHPTTQEKELLDQISSIRPQNGLGLHIDIAGETATKQQAISQASFHNT